MLLIDRNLISKLNHRVLANYKRSAFSLALMLSVCGILCLFFPIYAGMVLSYLTGVLLTFCGIYSLVCAYNFKKIGKGATLSLIIFGVIYAVMGMGVFLSPMLGMNILSIFICFLFILAGVSRLSAAIKSAHMVGRYWCMFIGILDLIIAFLWMSANQDTTYILVSVFIGLEMIFSACIYFTLSNKIEHLKKKTSDVQP